MFSAGGLPLLFISLHFTMLKVSPHTAAAAAGGKVSAVIVFGDSTVDSGNNNHIPTTIKSNFPPYGRDFDRGAPTGRFSNGRLVTDFVSAAFGLPAAVPAYLDTSRSIHQLAAGVSFASGGSGLDDLTAKATSAISLRHQLELFREYKERLTLAKGESAANEIIAGALFYFSTGNNDLISYFTLPVRRAQYTPAEYGGHLVGLAAAAVRRAYDHGARKVAVSGLEPVGCLPFQRTVNHEAPGQCNREYNLMARRYNAGLRDAVGELNGELAGATVVYTEMYSVVTAIIANPSEYGFENVARGCCGTGLVETALLCGLDGTLTCPDADKYVFFDSSYPSEKTYKILAGEMLKTSLRVFM